MHPGPTPLQGGAFASPLGTVVALASPVGLHTVTFDLDTLAEADQDSPSPVLDAFARWLASYLARRFDALPPVPLHLPTGSRAPAARRGPHEPSSTPDILEAVRSIRPGYTTTYGDLARRLGRPQAARAVGAAVSRNPLLLVVPCHRVLGAKGSLTGYAGGVERKAWLLKHEGVLLV